MCKENKKIIIFFLSLFCFLSCGNLFHGLPNLTEDPEDPVDPVIPEVIYTYPADKAEGVELNKSIIAVFNKEMNASTINGNTFIVKKIEVNTSNNQTTTFETTIDGGISIYNNDTVIFKLKNSRNMDKLSNYSVNISKDIQDCDNLDLKDNYIWGFKTGESEDNTGPEVLSAEPIQFIYTTENVIVKAVFNEDINPFTLSSSSFVLYKTGNGKAAINVPGTVGYEYGTMTALLIPADPIEPAASYEAFIYSGIKDLSDNPMKSDYIWDFRHLITYDVPCDIPGLDLDCCE